jgi:hypothetical protein
MGSNSGTDCLILERSELIASGTRWELSPPG